MKTTIFAFFFVLAMVMQSFAGTLRGAWEMQPESSVSNE